MAGKDGGRIIACRGVALLIENVRQLNGTTVVAVSGRLDALTAADAKAELHQIIADGNFRLVCNLSGLEFIDSAGLGVLVGCLRRCVAQGGDLCLAEVPESIRSVFELTRLTRVFQIVASESEAAELLRESAAQ